MSRVYDTTLEAKADSELCLERNAKGLGEPGGSKEVDRFAKISLTGRILELISVVTRIEYVEGFKEQSESHVLLESEELRNANV